MKVQPGTCGGQGQERRKIGKGKEGRRRRGKEQGRGAESWLDHSHSVLGIWGLGFSCLSHGLLLVIWYLSFGTRQALWRFCFHVSHSYEGDGNWLRGLSE